MYFVDREKIERTLCYFEELQAHVETVSNSEKRTDQLALERVAIGLIESILDVGNGMIDGFIMRDPGSYEDIIDILEDERVITEQTAASLKRVIKLRKSLVQDYLDIDHSEVSRILLEHQKEYAMFADAVRAYLNKELGPVSAFLPEPKKG